MISLIQRVTEASVSVNNETIGSIDNGILAFVGFEAKDQQVSLTRMADRILGYRIFSDHNEKMNLNVQQIQGAVLIVPQFTLVADTSRGMRPSFSRGATPEEGNALFDMFVGIMNKKFSNISTGQFGADMKVSLCNDGPVTFSLQVNVD